MKLFSFIHILFFSCTCSYLLANSLSNGLTWDLVLRWLKGGLSVFVYQSVHMHKACGSLSGRACRHHVNLTHSSVWWRRKTTQKQLNNSNRAIHPQNHVHIKTNSCPFLWCRISNKKEYFWVQPQLNLLNAAFKRTLMYIFS